MAPKMSKLRRLFACFSLKHPLYMYCFLSNCENLFRFVFYIQETSRILIAERLKRKPLLQYSPAY